MAASSHAGYGASELGETIVCPGTSWKAFSPMSHTPLDDTILVTRQQLRLWLQRRVLSTRRQVLLAHHTRREDRHKGGWAGCSLHVPTTVRLFALHQAHHSHDLKTVLCRSLDGLHGRTASRADIIHDHNARILAAETLNALTGPVLLLSLAHQEPVNRAAHNRHRHDDGIGTHGHTADSRRPPISCPNLFEKHFSGHLRTPGIEGCCATVDVVIARAARGQLKLSQTKRLLRQQA